MKSLSLKLGVVLIGLMIFGYTEAWGADWISLGKAEVDIGEFYYDRGSITHPSKDIVRVWEKIVYSEKGVNTQVEELGKRYKNLSHTLNLWEVNCVEKQTRILQSTAYSKDGTIIISAASSKSEWEFIIPGSVGEGLHSAVCK